MWLIGLPIFSTKSKLFLFEVADIRNCTETKAERSTIAVETTFSIFKSMDLTTKQSENQLIKWVAELLLRQHSLVIWNFEIYFVYYSLVKRLEFLIKQWCNRTSLPMVSNGKRLLYSPRLIPWQHTMMK